MENINMLMCERVEFIKMGRLQSARFSSKTYNSIWDLLRNDLWSRSNSVATLMRTELYFKIRSYGNSTKR